MPNTQLPVYTSLKAFAGLLLQAGCVAWIAMQISAPAQAQMKVTFVGNHGLMLESGDNKVLIDGLQNHTNTFWTRLSQDDLTLLVNGLPPFDNISYAMATHNHPDHYNSSKVLSFLSNNPLAKFIGPPQVRSSLGSSPQVLTITPAFQTESITITEPEFEIEVFHLEHFDQFGNDFSGVQNFAYLVTMGGVKLLHMGDVDYIEENFENFDFISRDIDVVALPTFNTLLTTANKQLILDHVQPRHIIAEHLRAGLASEEANVMTLYPDATIFTMALDSIMIEPAPMPEPDMNCDGSVDAFDIDPFITALLDPAGYEQQYPDCDLLNADVNGSGGVDAFDIDPFIAVLLGN